MDSTARMPSGQWKMPEMDGYDLTTQNRNIPSMKGTYVLLYALLNGSIHAEWAQRAEANAVLIWFVPEELVNAVRAALV